METKEINIMGEVTVAKEGSVSADNLQNVLRSASNEQLRSAMMTLYTAQPDNKALIELGNKYAAELRRRGL